jgi:hypothetical protein
MLSISQSGQSIRKEVVMDESHFQQPTFEQLRRFVEGDPRARGIVLCLVLPQLCDWGRRHYPQVPVHDVDSVIHDVLNETCQRYERYDPERAQFTTYVIELIEKRMMTVLKKQIRLASNEISIEKISEKSAEPTYNHLEADIVQRVDREKFFQRARMHLTQIEATFLDLMLAGEIHQQPFIEALTRSGFVGDPHREVNRVKMRLKYKLQKAAQVQGLRLEDLL